MDAVLGKLARSPDPNLLVGFDQADDAGVYRLSDELALVQTVDFFSPIVDDPRSFGQIAAANALSDVYAMGGRPLTALSIVGFPENENWELLQEIMAGGLEKLQEAGCTLAGGHSVRDEEIKFGYAITGLIDPRRILPNSGAQPGDALILTKALGTGVISTAVKRGACQAGHADAAVSSMSRLNRRACELMLEYHPHAVTDITGFGLAGHAREMALASGATLHIKASQLPLLPGAREYALRYQPQGLKNNRAFAECAIQYETKPDEALTALLFDPQTSGGLLIALPAQEAEALLARLLDAGLDAARIGAVEPKTARPLRVSL